MNQNFPTPPMRIDNKGAYGLVAHQGGVANLGYASSFDFQEDEKEIDLLQILWTLVRYRWLIAAFLAAGLASALIVTLLQTPKYRSTAQIEIQAATAKVIQDLEVVSNSTDSRVFETAREKMLSRDLSLRVTYELNLANEADFLAPTPTFSLTNIFRKLFGSTPRAQLEEMPTRRRLKLAADLIQENLQVSLKRNTSILDVTYSHPSPKYAELIANQLVKSFIDQGVDQRSETSDLARQFIEQQVRDTKAKWQESEAELIKYAQQEGITITGDDSSLVSDNINEMNRAISAAVQERLSAEHLVTQIANGDATSLPEVFQSVSIQNTRQKIAELRAVYQQKLATLKPGFPEMVRLRAQFRELEKQVQKEVNAIAKSVEIRYQQIKDKEEALKKELLTLEGRQAEFQKKNIQYTILKREVDSNRKQYESLIGKLNEVGVSSELRSANASIVDRAIRPDKPYSPVLLLNVALGMALAAILVGCVILVLRLLNNTIAFPDQIEKDLKLSVLGIVPKLREEEVEGALDNPTSSISEAYRTLRTSLQFTGTDNGLKTLTVTSSEPSEGKSTTAMKLAEDFAALGKSVLLIDADMRKPRQHRLFNKSNAIGLSNLLTNVITAGSMSGIFQDTDNPNLTLMSAGTIPPNPADILMSSKMGLMLEFCKKKYDLVVIDSPPVIGLADAAILGRISDATVLVIASKQVSSKSSSNALKRLQNAGANVVGAVLNKFKADELDYNYAYRYMQYNYYSYGPATESQPLLTVENEKNEPSVNRVAALDYARNFIGRLARNFS